MYEVISFSEFVDIIIAARRRSRRIVKYKDVLINISHPNYNLYTSTAPLHGSKCVSCDRVATKAVIFISKTAPVKKGYFHVFSEDNVIFTKDHIIPRAHGGKNVLENYQTMCMTCNQAKGHTLREIDIQNSPQIFSFEEIVGNMYKCPFKKYKRAGAEIFIWYNNIVGQFYMSTAEEHFVKQIDKDSLAFKKYHWVEVI